MAQRSRSQSVLSRQRVSATLIGAVGRASVGFGLAVGRSRSIRPIVNLSDVNSAALRPPTRFWSGGVDELGDTAAAPTVATSPARSVVKRAPARTTSATTRRQRPTWTDQVIQRSAIGYVAPPAGAVAGPLPIPDDFVPLGDPAVDHLRLLVRAAKAAEEEPTAVRRAPATRAPKVRAESSSGEGRGDTAGGRSTAPGRLAGSMRPDRVTDRSTATGRPGPGSAVAAGLPEQRSTSTSRGASPRTRPATRSSTTSAPSRLDQLRELLIAQGKLPAEGSATPADAAEPTGGAPGRPSRPETRPRSGGTNPGIDRSATTSAELRRAAGRATRPAPSSASAPATATPATPATPAPSAEPTREASQPGTPPDGSLPASPSASLAPSLSASTAALAASSTSPRSSPAPSVIRRAASETMLSSAGSLALADQPQSLRMQRLLGSPRAIAAADATTGRSVAPPTALVRDAGAEAGAPSTDRVAPLRVSEPVLPWSNQRPSLPSATATDRPLRRVTLPRALSVSFRPDTVLSVHRRHRRTSGSPVAAPDGARPTADGSGAAPRASKARSIDAAGRGAQDAADTLRRSPSDTISRPQGATSTTTPPGARPSVAAPSMVAPSMVAPSMVAPSIVAPSTAAPSTVAPSMAAPSMVAPSIRTSAVASVRRSPTGTAMTSTVSRSTIRTGVVTRPVPSAVATRRAITPADLSARAVAPFALVSNGGTHVQEPTPDATRNGASPSSATRNDVARNGSLTGALVPRQRRRTAPVTDQSAPTDAAPASIVSAPAMRVRRSGLPAGAGPLASGLRRPTPAGDAVLTGAPSRAPSVRRWPARIDRRPASGASTAPSDASTADARRSAAGVDRASVVSRRSLLPTGSGALSRVIRRATESSDISHTDDQRLATTPDRSSPAAGRAPAPGVRRADAVAADTVRSARVSSAPTRPPRAEQLADQFMTELSQTIQRTPAPLPTTFRPMADVITGGQRVMLSTDPASRRALRSVGKVAATTGSTIHLDRTAIPQARLHEVVAHELTHVAHPSPTPRFFDDVDDSPEERRAEQVAAIIARSPLAPSSSVVAPRSSSGADRTIRRTPAPRPSSPSASVRSSSSSAGGAPSVSADALAARLTGSSSASSSGSVIRRDLAPSAATAGLAADPQVTSRPVRDDGSNTTTQTSSPFPDTKAAEAWFDKEFEKRLAGSIDPLLRMIEDRMIVELERRGGRSWRSS